MKALINKHPTLSYKEVFYKERVLVLFFDLAKDEAGHDYFDEFFVTDLYGDQVNIETTQELDELKWFV